MNTWYSVDLGDGVEAFAPTNKIQESFMAAYVANGGKTSNMGAFSRYDLGENVVTVYFTPTSVSIAKIFCAAPCDKPSIANLSLLVGDATMWDTFFHGESTHRR